MVQLKLLVPPTSQLGIGLGGLDFQGGELLIQQLLDGLVRWAEVFASDALLNDQMLVVVAGICS